MEIREINGAIMELEVDGPPGGDGGRRLPLVLLHGFPLDGRIWADVARITAREVETVRPNFRGFGRLLNADSFTIASLAEDVHALLRSMGRRLPCVLAGLSMGGYVGLAFARDHPDALRGLGLVDTRAEADSEEGRQRRDEMVALVRGSGAGAVADQMFPKLLAGAGRDGPVAEVVMRMMLDCPGTTIEHALVAMRDRDDFRPLLDRLDVPAAVIVGEGDELTPVETAREMAEALPQAKLTVVPDAGHLSPLENPQAVAEALLDLVRRA